MRLVQFSTPAAERRVARVEGDALRLLTETESVYALAHSAIESRETLAQSVERRLSREVVDYAEVLAEGRMLCPIDHPDPAHVFVTGTGLTHKGSAAARSQMHEHESRADDSDSMKLFKLGLREGKPADRSAGVQPEWFYKGNGHALARPGHALSVPDFSLDAGEEPEIVGLYVVSDRGVPFRVGYALGNELSDHVTERQNYLYLAHSKLRPCSIGPELLLGELPQDVSGWSRIWRGGELLWEASFASGEANMSHWIASLEHHHFKYELFRMPGSVHVHFFGTATLSFAAGVRCQPGDVFEIECATFGKALRNTLEYRPGASIEVAAL